MATFGGWGYGILLLEALLIPFLPGFFVALYLVNKTLSIRSKEDRLHIKSKTKRVLLAFIISLCSGFLAPLFLLIFKNYMEIGREISQAELLLSVIFVFMVIFFIMYRTFSKKGKRDRLYIGDRGYRIMTSLVLAVTGGLFTWQVNNFIFFSIRGGDIARSWFELISFTIYNFISFFILLWMILSLFKSKRFLVQMTKFMISLIAGLFAGYLFYSVHFPYFFQRNIY